MKEVANAAVTMMMIAITSYFLRTRLMDVAMMMTMTRRIGWTVLEGTMLPPQQATTTTISQQQQQQERHRMQSSCLTNSSNSNNKDLVVV
jgi:hypothetical protein